LSHIRITP